MTRQIYVNLPVKNLKASVEFFTDLGFSFEASFSNEHAACLIVSEHSFVMLLVESFFQTFIVDKAVSDAHRGSEVLVCLSCDSRTEVDTIVARAVAGGGRVPRAPQDLGFMYGHAFEDLDGHIWELIFTDASAQPGVEA